MAIIVKRDDRANAVTFKGSTFATYWNGLLSASAGTEAGTVNVTNLAQTSGSNISYEYYEVPYTTFADATGSAFASVAETVEYINSVAIQAADAGGFETNQSNFFINGNTLDVSILADASASIALTGSANDFNTYVSQDIPVNIYNTSSGVMEFTHLLREDVVEVEVGYFVNSDVADANHEVSIKFTDNTGVTFSKAVTNAAVDSAAEDVEFLTLIPFYIGDNLITHPDTAVTASGEIFLTPSEDATFKIKNVTIYLTR